MPGGRATATTGSAGSAGVGAAAHAPVTSVTANPNLSARVQTLLPAGMTVPTAAAGFRNTGQFLATAHVAHNLGLSFTQLKAAETGSSPESLGKAIHMLNPNLSPSQVHAAVRRAERQAHTDLATANLTRQITSNPRLAAQVRGLLPAGTTLQTAAAGFRNEGQFLAALHVSQNLGIPFAQLKAKVTGPNAESLGSAIRDLRPSLTSDVVKTDVDIARHQAKLDIQSS
jgi:hypothetical protein